MSNLNWPGLFAWSTKYHDGTAPSQFKKMSDEDRRFLEAAFAEAFGKMEDPNKVMLEAIGHITSQDRTDEGISTALEVMDRLCDDVDVARNVEKLGGIQALLDLIRDKDGSIRCRALEILALLFSNNPNIQEAGMKRGALELLLHMTKDCPRGSDDRSKAFRTLVALVRPINEYEDRFLRAEHGLDLLVSLLDPAEEARTREKAASFTLSTASRGDLLPEEVAALAAAVARLLPGLGLEAVQHREVLSACAAQLARSAPGRCPAALAEAAKARLSALEGAAAAGEDDAEKAALEETLSVMAGAETTQQD